MKDLRAYHNHYLHLKNCLEADQFSQAFTQEAILQSKKKEQKRKQEALSLGGHTGPGFKS